MAAAVLREEIRAVREMQFSMKKMSKAAYPLDLSQTSAEKILLKVVRSSSYQIIRDRGKEAQVESNRDRTSDLPDIKSYHKVEIELLVLFGFGWFNNHLKLIGAGEELFYDYRYEPDRAPTWARKPEESGSKIEDGAHTSGRAKKVA